MSEHNAGRSSDNLNVDGFVTPSVALPKASAKTSSEKSKKPNNTNRDQGKGISNTFSFFSKKADPNESRYSDVASQDEGDTNMPFRESDMRSLEGNAESPVVSAHDSGADIDPISPRPLEASDEPDPPHDMPRHPTSQHFSTLRRPTTFFSRNHSQPESGTSKPGESNLPDELRRPRKIFTLFRKKNKDRERQPDMVDYDEADSSDEDRETGERAQGLINSLLLGGPAINLLASCLCEDEFGIARAPLLMNLIGIKVTDISNSPLTRNKKFRIDLEYGVWPQRLKWSVEKTARDLLYLHSRFKWLQLRGALKSVSLPRYPVPPSLRRSERKVTKQFKTVSETLQLPDQLDPTSHAEMHPTDSRDAYSLMSGGSFRDRLSQLRAHLTSDSSLSSQSSGSPEQLRYQIQKNMLYVKEIERYLTDLNLKVAMRPQSNRLFQFFEISPISSLLSYECGYIGKQGTIHVGGTARSQGWRVGHFKANELKDMIDRRSEKWFLVRGSYVMYVSDIISTTPLEVFIVDSSFKFNFKRDNNEKVDVRVGDSDSDFEEEEIEQGIATEGQALANVQNKVFKHLRIVLENSERKLVIIPKSKFEQQLWINSLNDMVKSNVWAEPHRFGSFAPVRKNCYAQWLVDARDYFWAVSSALELAKDVIFIHDWWLSPELYLRRPANGNQQFRIDRILQRKAQQGVKIFVIVYRNVGTTIPIDSLYTKHSILSLNQENIHVIRSPNQLLQNTFFWAHHEKLCIIDYNIAFIGGIDLCYGRYDTPDHVLADDSNVDFKTLDEENGKQDTFKNFRIFPGKDYSNTRVKDFSNLNKPYDSLYDRNVVPRMPWHDIHMMTSGEVARDLSRHFVQRWNYLLRQKRPSRLTPLLTPPPDLTPEMVKQLNLDGTCEVQILRSAGSWSLGLKEHEESIHQAYLKLIETSEHFIYIENQFFVTSCFIDGTEIQNRIGDALVDRIIRAHREGKAWKAIILIPLVPGFESQVDQPDGSSVRVVMQCEYMSISRGASSLFAKLRKAAIDPDDYIQFFSLRKWGIIGPDRNVVTEQLYIHAKLMIVDDRVAIIGSANINERSMRGSRDSEVAAIIRDTDSVKSTMDGKPYTVGKFVHSLRLRLMREHLGVAVDFLDIVERRFEAILKFSKTDEGLSAATTKFSNVANTEMSAAVEFASRHVLQQKGGTRRWKEFCLGQDITPQVATVPQDIRFEEAPEPLPLPISFNNRTGPHEANIGIRESKKHSFDPRVQNNFDHKKDVFGEGTDQYRTSTGKKARLDSARFLRKLVYELMETTPDKAFLPDIGNVIDFLELDDKDLLNSQDSDTEEIIATRNKERWLLLKKIAYLQLVASRDAQQQEVERKKRLAAGLPSAIVNVNASPATKSPISKEESESSASETQNATTAVNVKSDRLDLGEEIEMSPEKESQEQSGTELIAEQIPIVTLDDAGFRDTIRRINQPGVDSFAKFIDPYSFDDPLDPDFYEDIWFENARRNTDIFRMIFHCQPDDAVPSWKEYMHFMKMSKAFKVAQEEDAKSRKESGLFENTSAETQFNDDIKLHARRSSLATININDYGNDDEFFGEFSKEHNRRRSSRRQFSVEDIIEENSDDEGSDASEDLLLANEDVLDLNGEKKQAKKEQIEGDGLNGQEGANGNDGASDLTAGTSTGEEQTANTVKQLTANGAGTSNARKARKRRAGTFSARRRMNAGEKIYERDSAQRILQEIHGHLVLFPVDWLQRELEGGNWFFNTDRIPPIEIYD